MGGNSALTISLLMVSMVLVLVPLSEARQLMFTREPLRPGEFLSYHDYELKLEDDCNLVLYDSEQKVWTTNTTSERRDCICGVDGKGRLVIATEEPYEEVWASSKNTDKNYGTYVLILQADGNVVIYGPDTWETGTRQYLNARMSLPMAKTKPASAAAAH